MRAVDRNAQDLGILLSETRFVGVKPRNLTGSNWGECKRIEDDDRILSAQVRQLGLRPEMAAELKVRRDRADRERLRMIGRGRAAFLDRHEAG